MTDTTIDYSNDLISEAEQTAQKRQVIQSAAGDIQSMQGSIADAAQISLLTLGQLLLQLKAGKPIDEIISSDPVFGLCIEFCQAHTDGTMKVPFVQKPSGEAIKDIIYRTNAVAELYVDDAVMT